MELVARPILEPRMREECVKEAINRDTCDVVMAVFITKHENEVISTFADPDTLAGIEAFMAMGEVGIEMAQSLVRSGMAAAR